MVEEMHAGHNKTQQFQDHDPHDIAGKYVAINCSSVWTRCVRWQLPDFVIDTPFFVGKRVVCHVRSWSFLLTP